MTQTATRWAILILIAAAIMAMFILTARHGAHPIAGAHMHT